MEKTCGNCKYTLLTNDEQPCIVCISNGFKYPKWEAGVKKVDNNISIVTNERLSAILMVNAERDRQDKKWGQQNHAQQAWVGILGEEFGEYCQCVNETYLNNATKKHEGGYENLLKELTHVAAVAVGAMESLMRNREEERQPTRGKNTVERIEKFSRNQVCIGCDCYMDSGTVMCDGCEVQIEIDRKD